MADEMADVEDAGSWDYDKAVEVEGVRKPRAVVSVAFSREEFEQVAAAARRGGKRTSEFIRDAAVDQVASPGARATLIVSSAGVGSLVVSGGLAPVTRSQVLVTREEITKEEVFAVA